MNFVESYNTDQRDEFLGQLDKDPGKAIAISSFREWYNHVDMYNNATTDAERDKIFEYLRGDLKTLVDYGITPANYGLSTSTEGVENIIDKAKEQVAELNATNLSLEQDILAVNQSLQSYNQSILRLSPQYLNMTDEEKVMTQQLLNNTDLFKKNEEGEEIALTDEEYKEAAHEIIQATHNFYTTNADLIDNFETANNSEIQSERSTARQDMQEALNAQIVNDINKKGAITKLTINMGKTYGYTYNEKTKKFEDTQNYIAVLEKKGIKEENGNNLSLDNLKQFNNSDLRKVYELVTAKKINADTSMDTIYRLLMSSREMPKTNLMRQAYVDNKTTLHNELSGKLSSMFFTSVGEDGLDYAEIAEGLTETGVVETLADYSEDVRNGALQLRQDIIDGKISTIEELDNAIKGVINNDASGVIANLGTLAEGYLQDAIGEFEVEGYIDTFKELNDALKGTAEAFKLLGQAQNEYATTGKVSLSTTLEMLAADEDYINVLDFSTGKIKLKDNAEEILAETNLKGIQVSVQATLQTKKQELAEAEATLETLRNAAAEQLNAEALVGSGNQQGKFLETTGKMINGISRLAAILKVSGQYLKGFITGEGESLKSFGEMVDEAQKDIAGEITIKVPELTYDETIKNEILDELVQQSVVVADLTAEVEAWQSFADTLDVSGDELKDLLTGEGFDTGTSTTEQLEKLKSLLSSINKEYEQMIAFGDKGINTLSGTVDFMNTNYYDAQKEVLTSLKDKTQAKLGNLTLSDIMGLTGDTFTEYMGYWTDLQDYEIQLRNLDDEAAEDVISALETAGVLNQGLIDQYETLLKSADTFEEKLEYQTRLGEAQVQVFERSFELTQRKIDALSDQQPQEWTNSVSGAITQINNYYTQLQSFYQDQYDAAKELLANVSNLTDEQIDSITDKANEAAKNILQAQIDMAEAIKTEHEELYSAIGEQVNDYIDELEQQKEIVEDYYDKELEKLNDRNTAIERTNRLLTLQADLLSATQEKERTYRAGIGWVNKYAQDKEGLIRLKP